MASQLDARAETLGATGAYVTRGANIVASKMTRKADFWPDHRKAGRCTLFAATPVHRHARVGRMAHNPFAGTRYQ